MGRRCSFGKLIVRIDQACSFNPIGCISTVQCTLPTITRLFCKLSEEIPPMSATAKEIDKLEPMVRKLEDQARPKTQKVGSSSALGKTSAELARSSNFAPLPPLPPENGAKFAPATGGKLGHAHASSAAEGQAACQLAARSAVVGPEQEQLVLVGILHHAGRDTGAKCATSRTSAWKPSTKRSRSGT